MTHLLDLADFRAQRVILDPSDFALGSNEPDPPPTDLINEKAWHGIMDIADDVSIRTTSYQGSRITLLYDLWGDWIEALPSDNPIMLGVMLDVADDFNASIFNLLHGFYRQAISSLRNALEATAFGAMCAITDDWGTWGKWSDGEHQIKFGEVRNKLSLLPLQSRYESTALQSLGVGLFSTSEKQNQPWISNLYAKICKYSHARGDSTNNHIWESTGPIYSAIGMRISYHTYLEVYSLSVLLTKMAVAKYEMPLGARTLFCTDTENDYLESPFRPLRDYYYRTLYE